MPAQPVRETGRASRAREPRSAERPHDRHAASRPAHPPRRTPRRRRMPRRHARPARIPDPRDGARCHAGDGLRVDRAGRAGRARRRSRGRPARRRPAYPDEPAHDEGAAAFRLVRDRQFLPRLARISRRIQQRRYAARHAARGLGGQRRRDRIRPASAPRGALEQRRPVPRRGCGAQFRAVVRRERRGQLDGQPHDPADRPGDRAAARGRGHGRRRPYRAAAALVAVRGDHCRHLRLSRRGGASLLHRRRPGGDPARHRPLSAGGLRDGPARRAGAQRGP